MKNAKLVVILVLLSVTSYSQSAFVAEDTYWIEGRGGLTLLQADYISAGASMNYIKDGRLYKVSFVNNSELDLFGPSPVQRVNNFGVMVGSISSGKHFHIQYSGGIGLSWGRLRGKHLYTEPGQGWFDLADRRVFEIDNFYTPSIPLEVEVYFKPIAYFGIGCGVFVDLNMKKPMAGVTLKAGAGKFR